MILIALTLLLGACDNGAAKGQVTIAGDKLYLPPECRIERYNASTKLKPKYVFTKFDGKYPEYWPEEFELPLEFYLLDSPLELQDARNQESQDHGLRMYDLDGVVRMPFEKVVEHFRNSGLSAGFEKSSDEFHDTLEIARSVGMTDQKQIRHNLFEWGKGKHRLSFHKEWGDTNPLILLDIYSDSDMGGFTFLIGHVGVYLPKEDLYSR